MTAEQKMRLEALRIAAQVMHGAIIDERRTAAGICFDTLQLADDFLNRIEDASDSP